MLTLIDLTMQRRRHTEAWRLGVMIPANNEEIEKLLKIEGFTQLPYEQRVTRIKCALYITERTQNYGEHLE